MASDFEKEKQISTAYAAIAEPKALSRSARQKEYPQKTLIKNGGYEEVMKIKICRTCHRKIEDIFIKWYPMKQDEKTGRRVCPHCGKGCYSYRVSVDGLRKILGNCCHCRRKGTSPIKALPKKLREEMKQAEIQSQKDLMEEYGDDYEIAMSFLGKKIPGEDT